METRTVVFVGKPGCGKGTQAKLLSEKTGWPVFNSGVLFRDIAKENTPAGRKIKEEMESGLLAPPWFAMYLYLKTLFSVPADASVILDGFNRKVAEAELIVQSLAWLGRPFEILHVKISDAEAQKRLAIRRDVEGRADDRAVDKRLEEYYLYTEPALEIFRAAGKLVDINGEQSPEAIAEDVRSALNIT